MVAKIPVPITFNPYKHHFGFLLLEIKRLRETDWQKVNPIIAKIGSNLFDFYVGSIGVEQVCSETILCIEQYNIGNKDEFEKWLNPLTWRKITISDQSEWLLKKGNNNDHFVHIHPAKFSLHTIRIRANTLKTVLALLLNSKSISENTQINLSIVNEIRRKKLNLSPVKSLTNDNLGIMRLWKLFSASSL